MALTNTYAYTETVIHMDRFLEATHGVYRVVSTRDYIDKKGKNPNGLVLTLMVLNDDMDYGLDKNGNPRENNIFRNFDITVFSRHPVKKGDYVKLLDFDAENSFAIGFDLILRFRDFEVMSPDEATA